MYVVIIGWCNNKLLTDINIICQYTNLYYCHLNILKEMNLTIEDYNNV